jgi:orotate phosphoribosyltransferase
MLVDDVVTSGETLRHCAIALRSAGAIDVTAIAFARAHVPGMDIASMQFDDPSYVTLPVKK